MMIKYELLPQRVGSKPSQSDFESHHTCLISFFRIPYSCYLTIGATGVLHDTNHVCQSDVEARGQAT